VSVKITANGYVYETFGISKHLPIKLQALLMRAETPDNPLTAKCFIYDVGSLHEQSAPAAKQQKKIQKYNYFWLKQSFEQVFFFQRVQVPYTP